MTILKLFATSSLLVGLSRGLARILATRLNCTDSQNQSLPSFLSANYRHDKNPPTVNRRLASQESIAPWADRDIRGRIATMVRLTASSLGGASRHEEHRVSHSLQGRHAVRPKGKTSSTSHMCRENLASFWKNPYVLEYPWPCTVQVRGRIERGGAGASIVCEKSGRKSGCGRTVHLNSSRL
ncbi:hypothetical protein BKA61DRAFT_593361 [Leptodontidium sp. MPI-SDFR-AT-0119]|nr:hypothetical protein BKA61DRAFT_593361 [Leptodontidium sp. MPI-SDFR-AT-0119]